MFSLFPLESIEAGPLPEDLLGPYVTAVRIAELAHALRGCDKVPDCSLHVVVAHLEQLESLGDVFTILTGNAQELNAVRDRPVSYWNIVHPNAHLVAYEVWDRLLAQAWLLADSLGLVPGQCCADRAGFNVFHPSILRGHEHAVRDRFSRLELPDSQTLFAELALEVSKAARQRVRFQGLRQDQKPGPTALPWSPLAQNTASADSGIQAPDAPTDPFADFSSHQRTLLVTLWRNGKVLISAVLKRLYRSDSGDKLEALLGVIKRTNKNLAEKEMKSRYEVRRKGDFLELREV